MSESGITGYGTYLPSFKISRKLIADENSWAIPALRSLGKGHRRFCSWDEDAITMGVESLRSCLQSQPSINVNSLIFASTSAPYADYQNATSVALAADLPPDLKVMDVAGSLRASTSALITALHSNSNGTSYIVASDKRRAKPGSIQEIQYAAGSATLAVGSENIIAKFVDSHSIVTQFIDHYRSGEQNYDYSWEERWIRDEGYLKIVPQTVAKLLNKTNISADEISYFCMPGSISRLGITLAKRIGINADAVVDNLMPEVGDTGTPQALLIFTAALEKAKPGEKILLVGFGAGCDAILFECTEAIANYKPDLNLSDVIDSGESVEKYTQFLSFSDEFSVDWGMRAEFDSKVAISQLYRAQDQMSGFIGGQCPDCKTTQFPVLATCVNCGSTSKQVSIRLADIEAKVSTFTQDYLQYYPAPPMYWGLVQFKNDARLLMEIVGVRQNELRVGDELKMVYRIKQKDQKRGLHRYFWKATPVYSQGS